MFYTIIFINYCNFYKLYTQCWPYQIFVYGALQVYNTQLFYLILYCWPHNCFTVLKNYTVPFMHCNTTVIWPAVQYQLYSVVIVHPLTFLSFWVDFAWKSCVWVALYEKITNLMISFWDRDRSSESDRGILRETIWELYSFSPIWTCMNSGWWLTYVHWAQFLSVSNFMNFALRFMIHLIYVLSVINLRFCWWILY